MMKKETSAYSEENITYLSPRFESQIALEQVSLEAANVFYASPVFENLAKVTQQLAESMYQNSTLPIIENITKINHQLVESIYKFSTLPALKNLDTINEQLANSVYRISTLPIIENMNKINQQLAETMYQISTLPALQSSIESAQQAALEISELPISSSLEEIINSSKHITNLADILYKSELLTGNLESSDEEISSQEIHGILKEGNLFSQYKSLERKIDNLSKKVDRKEALQDKITKKDIILILLPLLLLPFFQPFLEVYNNWAQQPATQIIKTIKNEIKLTNEKEVYKNIRIVKKSGLQVKQSNKRNSKTLNSLELGELVEIIFKKKNWTKIRVIESEKIIEGWVYTRYLQKIN